MGQVRRIVWVGVLAAALFAGSASSAFAQTQVYVGTPPPTVIGTDFERPPAVIGTEVLRPAATQARGLALTGGDILGLCALAALTLATGTVLVRSTRRRRAV